MVQQISLSELINQFDVILLDSDGVLARGPAAVPGAPKLLSGSIRKESPISS